MHKVHTLFFETKKNECVKGVTRLFPDDWCNNSSRQKRWIDKIAKAQGLSFDSALSSQSSKVCWRASCFAMAMRVISPLEREILEEINIVATAKELSVHQAFQRVVEMFDQQGDIRAAALKPAYLLCHERGKSLAQALQIAPVFSAQVCRILILTEGDAEQSRVGCRLISDRIAQKQNLFLGVLGLLVKLLTKVARHNP